MTRYCPEYYSPDEVYPTEAQVESGVDFGPEGDDFTGTLVASGGSAPTTPGTLIGQLVTKDKQGQIAAGVTVKLQQVKTDGGTGLGGEREQWSEVSDSNGLVEFDGMIIGWLYAVWIGDLRYPGLCLVPNEGDSSGRFAITSVIGNHGA